MSWTKIPVTGGVVKTRELSALQPGEFSSITNCRLKKNDLEQLHNDTGTATVGTESVVEGPFYLSFEGAADKLMVVTAGDIKTADPSTGTFNSIQSFGGTVTKAAVVHRGNQYFVGTDQGNYVIEDNVARAMGMDGGGVASIFSGSQLQTDAAAGTDAGTSVGDHFVAFLTEYDSDNDVESEPITAENENIESGDAGAYLRYILPISQTNATADKYRIYSHYFGNDSSTSGFDTTARPYNEALRYDQEKNDEIWHGGLVAEVAIGGTEHEFKPYTANPSAPYPILYTDPITGGSLFRYLVKPADWDVGVLFQDSLVVNDRATSKQVLRYSPPGEPEYQPTPYFMYFATEASDEIVGLHTVGNVLLVLSSGGVHRVNYLPLAGRLTQGQGRAQEVLAERVGCVGREASVKVETSRGEVCVWLSRRGLEWSDGRGWDDACPDFATSALSGTLSETVLVNDGANYRVRLYSGTEVWDFYYHPSHLKNGKMKLMGPSTYPATVVGATTGPLSDVDTVWTASSSAVYKETGNNSNESVLTTGHLTAGPYDDLKCHATGLTHSAASNTTIQARIYSKLRGYAEKTKGLKTMGGNEYSETGRVETHGVGQYVRSEVRLSGSQAWSAGPIWLDLEAAGGDNG